MHAVPLLPQQPALTGPLKNPFTQVKTVGLILTLIGLLTAASFLIAALSTNDDILITLFYILSGTCGAAFCLTGALIGLAAHQNEKVCQSQLRDMQEGRYIVRWACEPLQWQQFVQGEWGNGGWREKSHHRQLLIGLVLMPVISAFVAFVYSLPAYSLSEFSFGFLFLLAWGLTTFLWLVQCFVKWVLRRNAFHWGLRNIAEAIISFDGVYFKAFWAWNHKLCCNQFRLREATVVHDQFCLMPVLELLISPPGIKALQDSDRTVVRVPIPSHVPEQEIRSLLHILHTRCVVTA